MPEPTTMIHATNAWNPTGLNLQALPGTRLYMAHADSLAGPRTFVFLGDQKHLTFVADLDGHVPNGSIVGLVLRDFGLYPHLCFGTAPTGSEPPRLEQGNVTG